MNAMEKLAEEISRVTAIRGHYEALRHMPNVLVEPQIAMMNHSLNKATVAVGSNDPILVVQALSDLADWTE